MAHLACRQCGKQFTRQATLREHLRAHEGSRLYKCVHCVRSFVRQRDCKAHQKVHQPGAYRWICGGVRDSGEPCTFSSLRQHDLKRHLLQASGESCRVTTQHPEVLTKGTVPSQMQPDTGSLLLSSRAPKTIGPPAQPPDPWGLADEDLDESMIDEEIISPLLREQEYTGQRASSQSQGVSLDAALSKPYRQRRSGFHVFDLEHIIAPDPISEMLLEQDAFFDLAGVLWHNYFSWTSDWFCFGPLSDLGLIYHTNLFALRRLLSVNDLNLLSVSDLVLVQRSSELLCALSKALEISEAKLYFQHLKISAPQLIHNKLQSHSVSRRDDRAHSFETHGVSVSVHRSPTGENTVFIASRINTNAIHLWSYDW